MIPRLALLVATLLLAGCIAPPDPEGPAARSSNAGGDMTAKESKQEKTELCRSGVDIVGGGQFCAERRLVMEGDILGVSRLEVDLSTFNGGINLGTSDEGSWGMEVVLRARGTTEEEAKRNLDRIQFSWSHVDGGTHFLMAKASYEGRESGYSASIAAELPRSILMQVVARTTNGAIEVEGVRTDGLSAQTTNGAVQIMADVTQVDVQTTNGAVDAKLRPTASGRISLTTTNGALALEVPEGRTHGYDVEGRTTNGKVDISLKDGQVRRSQPSNPYYDPQNDAQFKTEGYEERSIQSLVRLKSVNGAVTVRPL